jgi:hypothetical protein
MQYSHMERRDKCEDMRQERRERMKTVLFVGSHLIGIWQPTHCTKINNSASTSYVGSVSKLTRHTMCIPFTSLVSYLQEQCLQKRATSGTVLLKVHVFEVVATYFLGVPNCNLTRLSSS